MKAVFSILLLAVGITAAQAQAPAGAPPGTTATCNDGSYSSAPSKRGACSGHKGVKDWYAAADKATATPAAPPAAATGATAPASAPAPAAPAAKATTNRPVSAAASAPAAGGGNGQVWVNTSSKVYHCEGTRYYGKTKAGEYMSEAAAKQAGARPDHGKACS